MTAGEVVLYEAETGRWLRFRDPLRILSTCRADSVPRLLEEIEAEVESRGLQAAGFLSYEAAAAFDGALRVHADPDFPLLWFGLYAGAEVIELPPPPDGLPPLGWSPLLDREHYGKAIGRIKGAIASGETYQVNFSFPLRAPFEGDPWALFLRLAHSHRAPRAAYVDAGRWTLGSVSPELFFSLEGSRLELCPMKGTAPRGRTPEEDLCRAEELRGSVKDQAENLMIVDMVRNDAGRIAETGSVEVRELFALEKHPTLWQMTSTVRARTSAPVSLLLAALFPCASITGAPKARTMEIIAELEGRPRRIYTGAIGRIAPGRRASFSVAIRTVLVDRELGLAEYGVGSGVTWGSSAAGEYGECLLKARGLTEGPPPFALLESLLWTPREGYFLLSRHLERLAASAGYFDYPADPSAWRAELETLVGGLPAVPHKVRLLLSSGGRVSLEAKPFSGPGEKTPIPLRLAPEPVSSQDPFLCHKTTHREAYHRASGGASPAEEVLLWNERGELTEAVNANLVFLRGGRLVTPPLSCGLLPGTFRRHLLEKGALKEEVVTVADLPSCERIFLINSVRRWREGSLLSIPS